MSNYLSDPKSLFPSGTASLRKPKLASGGKSKSKPARIGAIKTRASAIRPQKMVSLRSLLK